MGIKRICVFCGSGHGKGNGYIEEVRQFAKLLVKHNYGLVYGGANVGLMGELARRESVAWKNDDMAQAETCLEFQQQFLRDHLSRWAYAFCDKVIGTAELPFYRVVARLLADFLRGEEEEIEHRLAAARGRVCPLTAVQ